MYDNPFSGPGYGPQQTQPNPYLDRMRQYQQPRMQQPYDGIIRVSGMDGAKAYAMPPNSRALLCFDNDDVFVIKSTDAAGWPTYDGFSFHRVPLESLTGQQIGDFVPRSEFTTLSNSVSAMSESLNDIKEMLQNGQQPVRKQSAKPASTHDAE